MTDAFLHADLEEAAREEMERACELGWDKISAVAPWGDIYEGYTPGGRDVCFERNYLWSGDVGGEIRVEVVVYEPREFESGVRLVRELSRPAQ